jgi:predicted secreted protein
MSYKADYAGNGTYPARSGACEPLQVTSGGGGGSPGTPAIGITKNPKEQTVSSGGTATWTIVVTNTGQVTLTNVRVTDPEAPDCNRTSAQIPALASMAPGASQTYTCSRPNVTASFTNVATDTGTPPTGPDVSASDSAHVTVAPLTPPVTPTPKPTPKPTVKPAVLNPDIEITKNPKSQTVAKGAPASWTIVVTNTGENKLHNVRVTDPKAPKCNRKFPMIFAPGDAHTYTCSRPNTQRNYTNVANVVGTSPDDKKVTDSDSAVVKVAPLKPAVKPKPKPKPPVISHEKPKSTG